MTPKKIEKKEPQVPQKFGAEIFPRNGNSVTGVMVVIVLQLLVQIIFQYLACSIFESRTTKGMWNQKNYHLPSAPSIEAKARSSWLFCDVEIRMLQL